MPRVSDEHRERQRHRIEAAAMECFRAKGVTATTMADIISASGLSAGAIYGYYKGRDELVLSIANRALDGRLEQMQGLLRVDPLPSPAVALRELFTNVPVTGADTGLVSQFWGLASSQPEVRQILASRAHEILTEMQTYLAAWLRIRRGMSDADAEVEARRVVPAVLGLFQGLVVQLALNPATDTARYADAAVALIEGALAE